MIRLSKIDDKLSIYNDKEIVLFGAGNNGKQIKRSLEYKGFRIAYFCDNDKKKWGKKLDGIDIISPDCLIQLYNKKTLIQISSIHSRQIEKQLESHNIDSFISFEEYNSRIQALCIYKTFPQSLQAYKALYSEPSYVVGQLGKECLDYALKFKYFNLEKYNVICLPPKTGNYTLENSLDMCGAEYIRIGPCYNRIFDELKELVKGKIRIITAVRDPIAQNLSFFFQLCSAVSFCDIPEFWENGGDIQILWEAWISHVLRDELELHKECDISFSYMDYYNKIFNNIITVQSFFERNFERYNGYDVYEYPFDKENGYSIVQNEEAEIFIYQLERLNDIKGELGEFLGIKDFKLYDANVGDKKWYAPAYKQALKELKLEKKYYDHCYSSKYIEHFYNDRDIGKFKQRWINNVKR